MSPSRPVPALRRDLLSRVPRIGASAPEDPSRAGIIHLGLGAFHRSHQAVHTARALESEPGDWGIIGFANRSRSVVDPLRRQDGLYSVLELGETGRRADIVDVHRGFGIMSEQPEQVVREIADPRRKILTLTVSESGYYSSPGTGRLNTEDPRLREDLEHPHAPRTVIGLIAQGLAVRAESGEPFAVLPCDNIVAAGHTARRMVTEYLEHTGARDDVLAYVHERVAFPNAMVDRIAPATTPATTDEVAAQVGVRDDAPVRTETFSMWVIEDDFPAGRPAWEHGGAIFSDEVEKYEQVKLRILNGPHSLIAYLGALDGRRIVPESFEQDFIGETTLALIQSEMLPSIDLPRGFDVQQFITRLEHRWHNHELGHSIAQVGSDGSMRLPQRLPLPALFHLEREQMPHLIALTVAAWFACAIPPRGFEPGDVARRMRDPESSRLADTASAASTPAEHARALLAGGCLSERLAQHEGFIDRVGELLQIIVSSGPRAAAAEALGASTRETRSGPR